MKKTISYKYIFRATITKSGKVLRASEYGLKAFKIKVKK